MKRVEGGSSLAEALGSHPKIFSKLYVNMVKAGESGGFLETILSRLAQYLESSKEIKDQIVSVMIYPLILMIVSGALHHHPGDLCHSEICDDLLRHGTGDPSADPDHPHLQPIRQRILVGWTGDDCIDLLRAEDVHSG